MDHFQFDIDSDTSMQIQCNLCTNRNLMRRFVESHVQKVHMSRMRFICEICQLMTENPQRALEHNEKFKNSKIENSKFKNSKIENSIKNSIVCRIQDPMEISQEYRQEFLLKFDLCFPDLEPFIDLPLKASNQEWANANLQSPTVVEKFPLEPQMVANSSRGEENLINGEYSGLFANLLVPLVAKTVPTVERTVPTAAKTVPTAAKTVPTVAKTVPTVAKTVPTAAITVPTVANTVPTVERTVPTFTKTVSTAAKTISTVTNEHENFPFIGENPEMEFESDVKPIENVDQQKLLVIIENFNTEPFSTLNEEFQQTPQRKFSEEKKRKKIE